jgi:archaellum biogenesis protein FlaJ (TadC family)
MLKILEKQSRISKDNKSASIENNIKVLNNISSALYEQRNIRLGENIDLDNKYKQRYQKKKKINDLLEVFKYVYSTANNLMEKKLTKITIKDLNSIIDRLCKENENLKVIFL